MTDTNSDDDRQWLTREEVEQLIGRMQEKDPTTRNWLTRAEIQVLIHEGQRGWVAYTEKKQLELQRSIRGNRVLAVVVLILILIVEIASAVSYHI